jgi:hypothetical protein
MTIWSLVNPSSVCYVKNPKFNKQGLAFSHNGSFMALAERKECKDFINIFSCDTWDLITVIPKILAFVLVAIAI